MMKRVTLALLLLVSVTSISAQVSFVGGTPEKLYAMAAEQGKLVFMDLYASWCPPCKMMERDVFSRKDVGDFMSKGFVSAKFNVDESQGGDLSRKYNVRSIPTYLVFDSNGELLGRMAGAMQPAEFISQMEQFLKK